MKEVVMLNVKKEGKVSALILEERPAPEELEAELREVSNIVLVCTIQPSSFHFFFTADHHS